MNSTFSLLRLLFVPGILFLGGLTVQAATKNVSTAGGMFDPGELAISIGDTVTWTQEDVTEHTVNSDDELFHSDTLYPADTFSYTFNEAGSFRYYCIFHGGPNGAGMSGIVVVSEPTENQPPFAPLNAAPANGASNQPVAIRLVGSAFADPDGSDFQNASQWILRYASNNAIALDSGELTSKTSLTNYSPAGLAEGTTYDWQVRYKDGRGLWSAYSTATRFTTLVSFKQQGTGLRALYNNILDFVSPLATGTNATISYDWGKTRPHRRITADDFAIRWEGSLLPRFTELYQIEFQSRGRGRVWVDGQLIIDAWGGCSLSQAHRGAVSLVSGRLASVRVDYLAEPAGAQAILRWTSPSQSLEVVPASRLFPFAPILP